MGRFALDVTRAWTGKETQVGTPVGARRETVVGWVVSGGTRRWTVAVRLSLVSTVPVVTACKLTASPSD